MSKNLLVKAYSMKSFPNADADIKSSRRDVQQLDQQEYDRYCFLHQWRERYAAITDESPSLIASNQALLNQARMKAPFTEDVLRKVAFPRHTIQHQSQTILVIINGDGKDVFGRINNCICHNCMLRGHAAVHCPFPSNKNRCRQFAEIDPEYKRKQNRRRNEKKKEKKRAGANGERGA